MKPTKIDIAEGDDAWRTSESGEMQSIQDAIAPIMAGMLSFWFKQCFEEGYLQIDTSFDEEAPEWEARFCGFDDYAVMASWTLDGLLSEIRPDDYNEDELAGLAAMLERHAARFRAAAEPPTDNC